MDKYGRVPYLTQSSIEDNPPSAHTYGAVVINTYWEAFAYDNFIIIIIIFWGGAPKKKKLHEKKGRRGQEDQLIGASDT